MPIVRDHGVGVDASLLGEVARQAGFGQAYAQSNLRQQQINQQSQLEQMRLAQQRDMADVRFQQELALGDQRYERQAGLQQEMFRRQSELARMESQFRMMEEDRDLENSIIAKAPPELQQRIMSARKRIEKLESLGGPTGTISPQALAPRIAQAKAQYAEYLNEASKQPTMEDRIRDNSWVDDNGVRWSVDDKGNIKQYLPPKDAGENGAIAGISRDKLWSTAEKRADLNGTDPVTEFNKLISKLSPKQARELQPFSMNDLAVSGAQAQGESNLIAAENDGRVQPQNDINHNMSQADASQEVMALLSGAVPEISLKDIKGTFARSGNEPSDVEVLSLFNELVTGKVSDANKGIAHNSRKRAALVGGRGKPKDFVQALINAPSMARIRQIATLAKMAKDEYKGHRAPFNKEDIIKITQAIELAMARFGLNVDQFKKVANDKSPAFSYQQRSGKYTGY